MVSKIQNKKRLLQYITQFIYKVFWHIYIYMSVIKLRDLENLKQGFVSWYLNFVQIIKYCEQIRIHN